MTKHTKKGLKTLLKVILFDEIPFLLNDTH